MAEAIHCPSCSTRYRLRPGRMKPSYRRAQCFSCGEVFPLASAVAPGTEPAPEASAATAQFDLAEVAAALEPAHAEASSLTLGDLEVSDSDILERTLSGVGEPLPAAPAEAAPAPPPTPEAPVHEAPAHGGGH